MQPLDRLSASLGGPRIWIKRDDCTGLGTGGNKTRKLEFIIADAMDNKADVVITQGAGNVGGLAQDLSRLDLSGEAQA